MAMSRGKGCHYHQSQMESENMAPEKAILRLKYMSNYGWLSNNQRQAVRDGIEALEKQVPKMPLFDVENWCCPSCGVAVDKYDPHCFYCGQAILWESDCCERKNYKKPNPIKDLLGSGSNG